MKLAQTLRAFGALEGGLVTAVLMLMTALPLIEIAGRPFALGIPGSIPIVQNATLWIALLGAALAASGGRLLALSTGSLLPERVRAAAMIATSGLAAAITLWLFSAGMALVTVEQEAGTVVAWHIKSWTIVAVMPAAFALITARLIWRAAGSARGRLAALAVAAVPVAAALAGPSPDGPALTVGLLILACAAGFGLPIFAAIGGAALLLFWHEAVPAAAVTGEIYRLSASPLLPALPLFTFAGFIFSEGHASKRLMRVFSALVGWMPGGLSLVTVLLLAFFTPFTGASGVTILSMGGLLLPMLRTARYREIDAIGLVTVSGSIGLLFPPSLPVILYGITARTPISDLFAAGLIPGVVLIAAVAGWGAWCGWKSGAVRQPFKARELAAAASAAKWELLLPVIVLVGLFGGFATLVEAAALTVFYAIAVECLIHRDLSLGRDLPRIAVECATLVGGFLIVLGVALGFTNYLIQAEVPMMVLAWVKLHIESPLLFLLALNVFLILVGAAMDIYSAILVIVPLIVPLGAAYGIDPVHLGIIFLANMELGYLTPPMGENIFLAAYRFNQPLSRIWTSVIPYWIVVLLAVLAITYLPLLGK